MSRRYVARFAALGCVVIGLATATAATSLAIAAGERPATLLPVTSLVPLTLVRVGSAAVVWVAVGRLAPRFRLPALAATGFWWLLWGVWQAWLLLART